MFTCDLCPTELEDMKTLQAHLKTQDHRERRELPDAPSRCIQRSCKPSLAMSVLDLIAHCLLAHHIEFARQQALQRTEGMFLENDFYSHQIMPIVDLTNKYKEAMQCLAVLNDIEVDLDANWPFLQALNRVIHFH